ncbi:MAG: SusD/RagB family nutrient-binding outer membrane lipoprotein, partial [Pedobacter sp.]
VLGLIVTSSVSCKKFLDINDNPNAATNGPADLVLPQAIVSAAAMASQYNTGLADVAGFQANIYGVGGYGTVVTYAYTTSSFTGLWSKGYDVAQDFQYVINSTSSDPSQIYSTSMARIMKAFTFSKLVDQYNDIPYFDALKGQAVLLPKYDNAVSIYEDLIKQLDLAIKDITTAQAANAATAGSVPFPNYQADPLFKPLNTLASQGAAMNNWMKFANTLKLKLLVKLAFSGKSSTFATAQLAAFDAALGVITDDAAVNPVYTADAGRQNPTYAAFGYSSAGVRANAQRIPTRWILSFYNGLKITDPGRSALIFREPTAAKSNQLGNEVTVTSQVPSTTPI